MDAPREPQKIPGYDFGTDKVAKSPISMQEWEELKKSALFSEEDMVYLRLSEEVLKDQVDDLLKIWRGIIFDHPHLRRTTKIPARTRSIPIMPPQSASGSANGCSTPRVPNTTRPGSTINTRSACVTTAQRRTRPIVATRSATFARATCWPSAPRSLCR